MRLLIARHAEDIGSPADDKTRELTERGSNQAKNLGEVLREFNPELIICSSLRRSIQTAEIASSAIPVPVVSLSIFNEMRNGDVKHVSDTRGYHELSDTFNGGETFMSLQKRVEEGYQLITENYSHHDRIVLISHGRYMTYLIGHLLGHKPDGFNLAIHNTSYVIISITDHFRPQLVLPVPGQLYV